MKKRKLVKLLALACVFALFLAACGGGASSTAGSEPAASTPAAEGSSEGSEASAGGEEIEIDLFSMYATPDEDANSRAYWAMIEKYQEDFPNVKINHETVKHDDYETKMKTYVAGDELADVFEVKGTMIPQLADDGKIVELQTLLDLVDGWEAGFKEGVFEDFTYNDKAWAAPMQMGNNHNIFWNEEIFKECGIEEFPATWEDFLSAIEALKAGGYVPIALGNKEQWVAPSLTFNTIVYRYADVDWYYSLRDGGGAKFTDPEFIAAAQTMKDLVDMGAYNTDMNSIDIYQQRTLYYNKQAAMMIDGFWGVAIVESEAPEDVVAATKLDQLPAIPDGTGVGNVNQAAAGWGYVTTTEAVQDPAKAQAIANLLQYITGAEYASIVVANSGLPSSNPAEVDESALSPLYVELMELNDASVYAPVFDVQLNPQVVDVFYSELQDLMLGNITPQQYAEDLQAEMDAS